MCVCVFMCTVEVGGCACASACVARKLSATRCHLCTGTTQGSTITTTTTTTTITITTTITRKPDGATYNHGGIGNGQNV